MNTKHLYIVINVTLNCSSVALIQESRFIPAKILLEKKKVSSNTKVQEFPRAFHPS